MRKKYESPAFGEFPFVSVIIAARNEEKNIRDGLESLRPSASLKINMKSSLSMTIPPTELRTYSRLFRSRMRIFA